jgi:hypothetical protein
VVQVAAFKAVRRRTRNAEMDSPIHIHSSSLHTPTARPQAP